jgi:hypothetical protein
MKSCDFPSFYVFVGDIDLLTTLLPPCLLLFLKKLEIPIEKKQTLHIVG